MIMGGRVDRRRLEVEGGVMCMGWVGVEKRKGWMWWRLYRKIEEEKENMKAKKKRE